jgi:hypothetical protein
MKDSNYPPLGNGLRYFYDDNNVKHCSGAMLGRRDVLPKNPLLATPRLYLRKLRLVDGDYDQGGAYWGYTRGTAIYRAAAYDKHGFAIEVFTRATSREKAKQDVLEIIPHAKFYR